MASDGSQQNPPIGLGPVGSFFLGLYRFLASLRLAVFLLVVLSAVLAATTVFESGYGSEFVLWYVYRSTWFIGLETLLAVNILAATVIRFPWGWRRLGFVVTHAGLLILMAGAMQTYIMGIEGNLVIGEGRTDDRMNATMDSQFAVFLGGETADEAAKFNFQPGPVAWKEGRTHDFGGSKKDVGLKVLKFYRHARFSGSWGQDEKDPQTSVVQVSLLSPGGQVVGADWLVAKRDTDQRDYGPLQLHFARTSVASIREDFLSPPPYDAMGEKGVLSVHFNGKMERISVDENLGKTVAVGEGGLRVELSSFLPELPEEQRSVPGPLLVLHVFLPDEDEPIQHAVFAVAPFLDMDRSGRLPVEFWYHHRAAVPSAARSVELLQTSDGALYARAATGTGYHPHGRVSAGDRVVSATGYQVEVIEHLPLARFKIDFEKIEPKWKEKNLPDAAALVEVTVDGESQEVWLQRNTPELNYQPLRLGDKNAGILFGYRKRPLGFDMKLLDFERKRNPGGEGDASYSSKVQLIDEDENVDMEYTISMNRPLTYGKYTFYQHSFGGNEDDISTLNIAYDPGLFLKSSGSLLMCVGIFIMYYIRKHRLKKDKGWAPPAG